VILVDVNLALYAYDASSPVHEPAKRWLTKVLSGSEAVGFPWATVLGFLRIATSPNVFGVPYSIAEAVAVVDDWFSHPAVTILQETDRHWTILRELLIEVNAKHKLVPDTHLAALSIEHNTTIMTRDKKDFSRFSRIRFVDPLVGEPA
jgi:uncharacterized protein